MEMIRQVPCVWSPPPMTDSRSQIRLLWIHAGHGDDEIRCTVSVWDLEDAPEFRAISYTWGSPDPEAFVHITSITTSLRGCGFEVVDRTRVKVRDNARYALWQARLHYPNSYLWIDSLCINQTYLREKTAQVARMAKIYGRAMEVLACIGPSDDSSNVICEASSCDLVPEYYCDYYEADDHRRTRLRSLLGMQVVNRLVMHFDVFSERQYFSRLWVIQELHSGDQQVVLCGESIISWDAIATLRRRLYQWGFDDDGISDEEDGCDSAILHLDILVNTGESKLSWSDPDGVWSLLQRFWCEDIRDRIYGVLGLIDWEQWGIPMLVPDYELSIFELAVRLIPRTCNQIPLYLSDLTSLLMLEELSMRDLVDQFELSRRSRQPSSVTTSRLSFHADGICLVQQDPYGRLCADLVASECGTDSAAEVYSLLKASKRLGTGGGRVLPSDNAHAPFSIYTGDSVSIAAWPEVEPGDMVVSISCHILVIRQVGYDTEYRIIGHALLLDHFHFRSHQRWTCACWTQEPSGRIEQPILTLSCTAMSEGEALMLTTRSNDSTTIASRVERYLLNIPPIGTVVEDTTTQSWPRRTLVRPIEESCTQHNAKECNRWRRDPVKFAAASGSGGSVMVETGVGDKGCGGTQTRYYMRLPPDRQGK